MASFMSNARLIEVQLWHSPPFYLAIEWSRFRNTMTEDSQWETLLALINAGSRYTLGPDPVIHIKSSTNPWGYGDLAFPFCVNAV